MAETDPLGIGTDEELRETFAAMIVGELIGDGKYGDVYAVTLRGAPYAAKFIPMSKMASAKREIRAEKLFRANEGPGSNNMTRILAYARAPGHLVLLMERMHMTFNEYVYSIYWPGRVPEEMIAQLLSGLAFLHRLGLAHQDLHGRNIMVNVENLHVRIIDLGLSEAGGDTWDDLFRTRAFIAEVVHDAPAADQFARLVQKPHLDAAAMLEHVRDISRNRVLAVQHRLREEHIVRTTLAFLLGD